MEKFQYSLIKYLLHGTATKTNIDIISINFEDWKGYFKYIEHKDALDKEMNNPSKKTEIFKRMNVNKSKNAKLEYLPLIDVPFGHHYCFLNKTIAIFGGSGEGKTTALQNVMEYIKPFLGNVYAFSKSEPQNHTYSKLVYAQNIKCELDLGFLQQIVDKQDRVVSLYNYISDPVFLGVLLFYPYREQIKSTLDGAYKEYLENYLHWFLGVPAKNKHESERILNIRTETTPTKFEELYAKALLEKQSIIVEHENENKLPGVKKCKYKRRFLPSDIPKHMNDYIKNLTKILLKRLKEEKWYDKFSNKLNPDHRPIIHNVINHWDINPNVAVILDDVSEDISLALKNNKDESFILKDLFTRSRHLKITLFFLIHDPTQLSPSQREQIMVNMFCSHKIMARYYSINNINPDMKLMSSVIVNAWQSNPEQFRIDGIKRRIIVNLKDEANIFYTFISRCDTPKEYFVKNEDLLKESERIKEENKLNDLERLKLTID